MNREDFTAMLPENDKYVGSNIYLNGKNDGFEECLQMINENMNNFRCSNCKYFSKNKNLKDGTCQNWKARCGGQRVESEEFCSDFEKKIDKN